MRFTGLAALGLAGVLAFGGSAEAQEKELLGALLGGVGGAVAGAQFGGGKGRLATTAAGTLLGAFVGQSAGRSLDRADTLFEGGFADRRFSDRGYSGYSAYPSYREREVYYAPPARVLYAEPRYKRRGYREPIYAAPVYAAPVYAPPTVTYRQPAQEQRFCREYLAPITIGGREIQGYGQACMQPDGSWELGPLTPDQ